MQLIVPMSGQSERFQNKGFKIPKFMLRIGNKTIIQHVVELFPEASEVIFIVNTDHFENKSLQIQNVLREIVPECQIVPIAPHKLGPSYAVLQAADRINPSSPTVINYCDFGGLWDLKAFKEQLYCVDGLIATYSGFHPHMLRSTSYAYVAMRGEDVVGIKEKESFTNDRFSEPVSSGTYGFGSGKIMLSAIQDQLDLGLSTNGEFYTSLSFLPLISKGLKVGQFPIKRFFQWGTPEDYLEFQRYFDWFELQQVNSQTQRTSRIVKSDKRHVSLVLLAAGEGKRFSESGYQIPKPVLKTVSLPAWKHITGCFEHVTEVAIVTRKEISHYFDVENGMRLIEIEGLSNGQAASALAGLVGLTYDVPVIIASCDAIFHLHSSGFSYPNTTHDLEVWTAPPTSFQYLIGDQYCWVELDDRRKIIDISMKKNPASQGHWEIVTGTFAFRSRLFAISLLTEVMNSDLSHRGEKYIDHAITLGLESGLTMIANSRDDYLSVGTPEEYETFMYWQDTFSKWAGSSYVATSDDHGLDERHALLLNKLRR